MCRPLVGTTDVNEADSKSAIAYANYQHFGGKYLVLAFGTHDYVIPYHLSIKFDESLRNAGVPHKTCIVLKGGHGEQSKCVTEEIENYVLNLTSGSTASLEDGRHYYLSNLTTHNADDVWDLGSESGGMDLPFTATIPVSLDISIDGGYYIGQQQPADIILVGAQGKAFKVQLLDANHVKLNEWSGVFGTGTTGDEYHVIQNVQFGCSNTCTYYWKFEFDGKEISPYNTPFLDISGNPKESYTNLITWQKYVYDIEQEMGGSEELHLNMGITSLPSCGNLTCEQWENELTCPEDCI
jgi:hypothetical protein